MDILERKYMPEIEKFEHDIRPVQMGRPVEIVKEEEQREDINGDKVRRILQVGEEVKDSASGQILGRLKEDWIQDDPRNPPVKHVVEDIPPQNLHIHEHIGGKEYEQLQKLNSAYNTIKNTNNAYSHGNMPGGGDGNNKFSNVLPTEQQWMQQQNKFYNRNPLLVQHLKLVI
ncbi:unnamed protein product [Gordionus sp. m RMFG-2023]|uniref:uncharacterized protein LOC135926736 n=1 Tax=Gordionus sp. m RMFG-2023 TaxID=3053472 RepID=UPI0030DFEB7E